MNEKTVRPVEQTGKRLGEPLGDLPTEQLSDEITLAIIDGAIAVITIDRPAQRNAINRGVIDGLKQAWQRLEQDPALRVGILTGTGDKAFCAGMDLKEAAAMQLRIPPRDMFPVLGDNVRISKPTIAAVNGVALAGGWLFAQMCDLCVASEHATFGITEAKVGRGMPWAAPLIHMLPQRIAMEVLLTGKPISAQRAYALGYVNEVVPQEQLLDSAVALARGIAANAPLTVKAARELVYLSTEMGRSAALDAAQALFEPVYLSEDAQEGPRAFAEKRAPQWKGC
ncbi:enoyl-CoA hydratase-related protein [Bordetella sp. LUAb4]|uniref:enoyl-CoA hydratase/isomerase family protein n=1 Tax=Bordetella sp. LUAb4 TaxID=2843195 RepID=UPI001E5E0164